MTKPFGYVRRAAVLALFAATACDDGGTGPATPASIVAMTATTQSAVVASAVPIPPSVLVSDDRGRPFAGTQVTFAVTGGDGTVTATALTNAGGIATAADWIMGSVAGENVLTASVPGVAPVAFRATAAAGAPTALEKAGGDGQSAAVATVPADSIAVRVVDQFGNGVPGVQVNFTASSGTLSATHVATGAQGHARVSLTLPIRPGIVRVFAGVGAMEPQVFDVTVTAGPPAAITRTGGDGQSAYTGTAVPVAPSVRVTDAFGNPVPGRPVTFTPASGSGVVTGGTPVTNADGNAQVGSWILGEPGLNRLAAGVVGLSPLEFTATARVPCGSRTYTLFTTLADELLPDRCTVAGRNAEVYSFTVPAAQCVELRMSSTQFDTYLYLLDDAGNVLAADDDSGGSLNSRIRMHLSAGTYRLGAAAYSGAYGPFELGSSFVPDGEWCGASFSARGPGAKGTR
jgi:hypothetical protein